MALNHLFTPWYPRFYPEDIGALLKQRLTLLLLWGAL
jgi:hypothetical protein